MTTLDIEYSINDLFINDNKSNGVEDYEDDFTCPVCFESYHKKKILQCKEGCTYCNECWSKSILVRNECMSCKCKVTSMDDLSRNRYIEKQLLNQKCYCPYSFKNILDSKENCELYKDLVNGCNEVIKLEQLESHIYQCKFRFVKCENDGCNEVLRLNKYIENHKYEECKFQSVKCTDCKMVISKNILEDHKLLCQYSIIKCHQCLSKVKRIQFSDHISHECKNTMIECKYVLYGCKSTFKRSELQDHLEKEDHTLFINHFIDSQTNQLKSLKLELNHYKTQLFQSNEFLIDKLCQYKDFPQDFNKKFTVNWIIPMFSSNIKNDDLSLSNVLVKFVNISQCKFELNLFSNEQEPGYISLILKDLITLAPFKFNYSFNLINKKDSSINLNFNLSPSTVFETNQCLNFINLIDILIKDNGWLSNEIIDNIEYEDCFEIEFIIEIKSDPKWKTTSKN